MKQPNLDKKANEKKKSQLFVKQKNYSNFYVNDLIDGSEMSISIRIIKEINTFIQKALKTDSKNPKQNL